MVLDEDSRRIEVIVPDAQLSLAIGRRGQNVRLASQLTGWDIDIVTESEDAERRTREFKALTEYFVEALNVEEVIAQLLVTEGFTKVEELVYVELDELASIQGFDESIAEALRERAQTYLAEQEASAAPGGGGARPGRGPAELRGAQPGGDRGARTQGHQVAGRPGRSRADELVELLPDAGLTEAEAGELIMAARAHWSDGSEAGDGAEPAGEAEATAAGPEAAGAAHGDVEPHA